MTLRRKLIASFLVAAAVPTLLAGAIGVYGVYQNQIELAQRFQEETAKRAATRIEVYMEIAMAHLEMLVRLNDIGAMADGDLKKLLDAFLRHRGRTHPAGLMWDVAVIDERGAIRACASLLFDCAAQPMLSGKKIAAVLENARKGEAYNGAIEYDGATREPILLLGTPVETAADGQFVGAAAGWLRLEEAWDIVGAMRTDQSGVVYVLDEARRVLAHPDPSVVLAGAVLEASRGQGVRPGLSGEKALVHEEPLRLGDLRLTVVAERPFSAIIRHIRQALWEVAALLMASLAAVAALGMTMAVRIVEPVEDLTNRARQMAEGDFSTMPPVERDDELGLLARAFNSMAATVKASIDDLNERIRERDRALGQLSRSHREFKRLAYISAHHLQEPTRVIANYAQKLERVLGNGSDEAMKRSLEHIQTKVHKLRELHNGMTSLLSIDPDGLRPRPVDLAAIFREQIACARNRYGADIDSMEISSAPLVAADPGMMRQLAENLVDNAFKYKSDKPLKLSFRAEQTADEILFAIQDNGIGLDRRYREQIFDIFERLEGQDAENGAGVGLALCRKIIESHDGRIWLESLRNEGTTVFFTLKTFQEKT